MATRLDTTKQAASLAFKHRQAIKEGDFTPFIPALAMAIAKDCLFDVVPIVGNLLGVFVTVYLFIFLWGKGKWKVRVVIFFLSLFDVIPAVNLIPFSTICVIYAYLQARKAFNQAKKELPELEGAQTNAEMIREYQVTQAMAAAEEAQAMGAQPQEQSGEQNSATPAPVPAAPRMMSDMKLPQSAVVPQGMENSAQIPEPSPGGVGGVTQGSVLTETQVRERYEQPRRDVLAERYRKEKESARQKYNDKRALFANSDRGIPSHLATHSNEDILWRLHPENMRSKQAIGNTARSIDSGDLNIAKLARENNAVMVHAIPLDGWSMKNTSMNNEVVDVTQLSAAQKGQILIDKQPDIAGSIINVSSKIEGQQMFYPFGFIVDGKLIAAYEGDEGTIAVGDARRRKEEYSGTLQEDTAKAFEKSVGKGSSTIGYQYNESIIHKPVIRGILIDEEAILADSTKGDEVTENFPPDQEEEAWQKYGESIVSSGKGTPTSGPYAGTPVFRIRRQRTGVEKALDFAKENYPDQPVYIRKNDGVYTVEGKKVTAEEIYS